MKKSNMPAAHRLNRWLSFPDSALPAAPYIELQGDMAVALSGYESLLMYEEHTVMFRMKPGAGGYFDKDGGKTDLTLLRITGDDLTIHVLRPGCLSVRGRICAVILHEDTKGGV